MRNGQMNGFDVGDDHHESPLGSRVIVDGTPMVAEGDTSGYLLGAYLGVSREFPIDEHWMVRPTGGVRYLHQSQDGYRDSEGLSVDDLSLDTLHASVRKSSFWGTTWMWTGSRSDPAATPDGPSKSRWTTGRCTSRYLPARAAIYPWKRATRATST